MANPSKQKGYRWEKEAEEILNKAFPGTWKRIPGSGAFGTVMNLAGLTGDLIGHYDFFSFTLRAENKVGYGGKEMTVKKEWFDKISEEASKNFNEIPCVLLKFEQSRSGVRYVVAFDFDAWHKLLKYIDDLYIENVALREALKSEQ
jgi:hypothetical protein